MDQIPLANRNEGAIVMASFPTLEGDRLVATAAFRQIQFFSLCISPSSLQKGCLTLKGFSMPMHEFSVLASTLSGLSLTQKRSMVEMLTPATNIDQMAIIRLQSDLVDELFAYIGSLLPTKL